MSIKISRRVLRPRGIRNKQHSPITPFNNKFHNARRDYFRHFGQSKRYFKSTTTVYSVEAPRGTQRIDFRHNPNKFACVYGRQSVILLLEDSSDFSACQPV